MLPSPTFCGEADAEVFEASEAPGDDAPLAEAPVDGSACGAVERSYDVEASPHVADCTKLEYSTDPPTSGTHYGHWAAFGTYAQPVPRGFYVHSMEHGAVVLLYSCSDCASEVADAQSMIDALPLDPLCSADVQRRVILTPDPLLEARWAAAAWGATLEADCFEPDVFSAFVDAHYAAGPENVCGGGVRPSAD